MIHQGTSVRRGRVIKASIASEGFLPSNRTDATGWVGAILYRGVSVGVSVSSKRVATVSAGLLSVNRPHMTTCYSGFGFWVAVPMKLQVCPPLSRGRNMSALGGARAALRRPTDIRYTKDETALVLQSRIVYGRS